MEAGSKARITTCAYKRHNYDWQPLLRKTTKSKQTFTAFANKTKSSLLLDLGNYIFLPNMQWLLLIWIGRGKSCVRPSNLEFHPQGLNWELHVHVYVSPQFILRKSIRWTGIISLAATIWKASEIVEVMVLDYRVLGLPD